MNVASCTIDGCAKPHKARGYCATHYTRWYNNGDPNVVLPNSVVRGGGYYAVHKWLYKHYGKADKCENPQCKGTSKTYQWAKLPDKEYEHRRENFVMLCVQCHRLLDMTDESVLKSAKSLIAKRNTEYCKNGHKRTDKNTVWGTGRSGLKIIIRCKECFDESQRRYRDANRVA